ncbi:YdiU family protein [Rhizobium sp. S95]|uniref:Protein nucleotidyltransferase YdiU n=1 Tax=Ciceribacter sichuanensis TaxID=2949647 RepID=A0AAJ1FIF0_9HYPH|nr:MULTISPECIES: YdiU family protein [unclassified Ciceribacter]MCM2398848.1 YdiU family protein [Ciceribacter sp. S95]MCO5956946.1 YdiU family protein [Ciceribacter sp. S101]
MFGRKPGGQSVFAFDNSYQRLPERFFRAVKPATVRAPRLIRFNAELASELGLDFSDAGEARLAEIFSGNDLPEGAASLAMAYAGHQFGNFVPQLGDGRAILIGEVVDRNGVRRDIQLKGAGATPFSRNGDGRAALGPVLREYIVSEAMHALGIPTTRALAAVLTGEPVVRETLLPGAVLTRVAASHIRIGTFQFFAVRGDADGLRVLADHVIARHYPEISADDDNRYLALLNAVSARQAELVARWLSVGFIHGVMNTDNMAVSGETIDFGPCAFLDEYDPRKVFSSIDQRGRYAYANQPGIAQWNLARFAEALLPLFSARDDESIEAANAALVDFGRVFQSHWIDLFRRKIGIGGEVEGDVELVNGLLSLMHEGEADFTLTFRALGKVAGGADDEVLLTQFKERWGVADWLERWRKRHGGQRTPKERQASMDAVNPAVIPRNHRIEEVIVAGLSGDFEPFEQMHAALQRPYAEDPAYADYALPPMPAERVMRTFCGT